MELNWPLGADLDFAQVRDIQIEQLREIGYNVNEAEVPLLKNVSGILADAISPAIFQCRLLGIRYNLNELSAYFPVLVTGEERWRWLCGVDDGETTVGISPLQAEARFRCVRRRGLTIQEGLALYRANPGILKERSLFLIGSHNFRPIAIGKGVTRLVPILNLDDLGHVELTTRPIEIVGKSRWGSPSISL